MALKMSTDLKNYIISKAIIEALAGTCGTGGTGSLKIYTGSQPSDADQAASGDLLCTISGIGWASGTGTTSGTATLASTSGYAGTATTSGSAGWARMELVGLRYDGSSGTMRIDGNVGTSGTCTFSINVTDIASGGVVTLLTAPIYMT